MFRRRPRPTETAPTRGSHPDRRPRNVVQSRSPARVLVAGAGVDALARAVHAVDDDGRALVGEDELGPRRIDAVLLGRDVSRARTHELTEEATAAGIPVLHAPRRPVIDVREVNPRGWQRSPAPLFGVLFAHPDRARSWQAIDEAVRRVGSERVVLLVPQPWKHVESRGLVTRHLPSEPRQRGAALQTLRGVLDLPDLHQGAPGRAEWIVEVAARGVPVVGDGLAETAGWIAEPLEQAISMTQVDLLDDDHCRERLSVLQRRRALRHHGDWHVWRDLASSAGLPEPPAPSISVLLATNRPDHLLGAIERIDRQHHPEVEVVVALHGDGFADDVPVQIRRATTRSVEILHQPAERPLGMVLNAATAAASGLLVAKMDDDDLYDVDHLTDLVEALRYSDATLVGKGSEFVYLEELDTTVRRFPRGAESGNRNVAGGTLMIGRDDLIRAGWWQHAPRAVDQRLVDDVERAGGRLHRTHGTGFILYRRGHGHTWQTSADYFLRQAIDQWSGLALDAAGIH